MKRIMKYIVSFFGCVILFAGCEDPPSCHFMETRTVLYKTNIIGISGPSAGEGEEYLEIRYSVADNESPGCNKTESIMVSPPYVFQNDRVYMQYDFYEWRWLGDVVGYEEIIRHDYKEGGAEYLQIINQSTDKEVEFFFAGGQDLPETIEEFNTVNIGYFEKTLSIPSVQYEKAPVQYLFFPDCKPKYNIVNIGILYTFEGSSCGDITITDPWTVDAVNELYRAEYNRFNEIKLFGDDPTEKWRLIDAAKEGGKFFWGSIKPGECIEGSDKIWLLATPIIFIDSDYYKN